LTEGLKFDQETKLLKARAQKYSYGQNFVLEFVDSKDYLYLCITILVRLLTFGF